MAINENKGLKRYKASKQITAELDLFVLVQSNLGCYIAYNWPLDDDDKVPSEDIETDSDAVSTRALSYGFCFG